MNLNKKNMKNMMLLISFAALMLWVVFNYKVFIDLVNFIFKLLLPLIIGITVAFIINVPMKQIETKLFKVQKRKHKKCVRILSLIISILLIFGFVGLLIFLVVPEVIEAIINITKSITNGSNILSKFFDNISNMYPNVDKYINKIDFSTLIHKSVTSAGSMISFVVSMISSIISRLLIFFAGFIISIYILLDKENLSRQVKKILTAFFDEKVTNKVIRIIRISNITFTKFLTGQCLDALLIGFLFFVILSILNVPYAVILGILFSFTALIPYVGAFITLIVGTILIFVTSPVKAIWYIITFILIQQFDDNFTYPKIVGGSVGLPALWALLAVLVGGSIFGIVGMLISIPIASILYGVLKDYINQKIEKKITK